ncbi:MAG: exodeoxyribonuclease V subunit gamma [Burkholderiaceae bacterium]
MALRIRFDHRVDRLADALLDALEHEPAPGAGDPLAERTVIVPSVGVGRWLQRRDASRHGVSTRLRPEFAGRWLWRTMRASLRDLPERSPFEPERVRWPLMELLGELPDAPEFALVRKRVREEGSLARLSLADALAARFDRYLAYRRDWLARWQRGQWASGDRPLGAHEAWQRWMWQRLLERLPGVRDEHPYDQFARQLASGGESVRRALGGTRIALFGRIDLSPEQFALFGQLSASIDVSLFAPDPCRELWTDMVDSRRLAEIRAQRPDVAWLYEGEPTLLGNWGRAQRDFVAQVLSLEEQFGAQAEAPGRDEAWPFGAHGETPARGTLQALQAAVFLRSDDPWRALDRDDGSIAVLGAHGFVRQAEVLHERLLECFETLPRLAPSEVVVYCADLESAAAAIEGVFDSQPAARRIPFAISGRAPRADPLVAAVQGLLEMTLQSVSARSLDAWLRNPAVTEALGLEAAEVELLTGWFEAAGARRGLDDEDGSPKHSLRAAIDRLLAGAALGQSAAVGDLLAIPGAQGTRARILEAWLPVGDALAQLRLAARSPRPLSEWCAALGDSVEAVFVGVRQHAPGLQRVRDALSDLLASASGMPAVALDAAAFERSLADALARGATAAMPGGAVTVCPLGSLPGVPFRVVCLFGMDEGAFPRQGARDELDLMRRAPRFGDRLSRIDDRGTFLDAVLSARDRLLVSCRSRHARDDTPLNPSPLVGELLAYLSARLDAAAGASFEANRRRYPPSAGVPALVEHPLHPFSARNFVAGASYAQEWLATARELARPLPERAPCIGALVDPADVLGQGQGVGAPPGVATMPIEALRDALADPVGTWLRDALGLRLLRERAPPDDAEPLWTDDDDRGLVQACVDRLLAGEEEGRLVRELSIAPQTAAGAPGRLYAGSAVRRARALVAEAISAVGASAAGATALPSVADLDGLRVSALVPVLGGNAPVFVTAFPLGPHALIDAWLRAAVWRAVRGDGPPACLVSPDYLVELRCPDPQRSLRHALDWAARIGREPLALFPRSWMRYALELARTPRASAAQSPESRHAGARERARDALVGGEFGGRTPELARPAAQALFRDAEPDIEAVLALGERVYRPVFDDVVVEPRREESA